MKTRQDIEDALKLELIHWKHRQDVRPFDDFYLYYMPTTAEHDGGIMIYSGRPTHPNVQLAAAERLNKGQGVEENFAHLLPIIRRLPVLEVPEWTVKP